MSLTITNSEYMTWHEWLLSLKTIKVGLEISKELGLSYQPPNWSLMFDFDNGYGFDTDSYSTHVITNLFNYEICHQIDYGDEVNKEQLIILKEMNIEKYISAKGTLTGRMLIFDSSHNFKRFDCELEEGESHFFRTYESGHIYFLNNHMVLAIDEYAFNPLAVLYTIANKFKEEGYGMEHQDTVST